MKRFMVPGKMKREGGLRVSYHLILLTAQGKLVRTTYGCAHPEDAELRGRPRRNGVLAAPVAVALVGGMGIVVDVALHKMKDVEKAAEAPAVQKCDQLPHSQSPDMFSQ
jgi:hypothetical protein